jgi:2-amino-4-ketopentanoate thiolase alpha subunit
MPERVHAGTLVELRRVLLTPGERAAHVPDDTQRVPLELRVHGLLLAEADVGDEASVRTAAGRLLSGTLEGAASGPLHTFGPPEPTLLNVGAELRALLRHDGR